MNAIWSVVKVECLPSYGGKHQVIFKVVYQVRKALGKKPWESTIALDVENLGDDFISAEDVTEQQIIQWVKDRLLSYREDFVEEIENCTTDEDEPITLEFSKPQ